MRYLQFIRTHVATGKQELLDFDDSHYQTVGIGLHASLYLGGMTPGAAMSLLNRWNSQVNSQWEYALPEQ